MARSGEGGHEDGSRQGGGGQWRSTLLGARLCRPRCTRCASLLITTGAVSSSSPPSSLPPRLLAPSRSTTCCRAAGTAAGGRVPPANAASCAQPAGRPAAGGSRRPGAAVLTTSAATVLAAPDEAAGAAGCPSKRGTGGSWRSAATGRLGLTCKEQLCATNAVSLVAALSQQAVKRSAARLSVSPASAADSPLRRQATAAAWPPPRSAAAWATAGPPSQPYACG